MGIQREREEYSNVYMLTTTLIIVPRKLKLGVCLEDSVQSRTVLGGYFFVAHQGGL